MRIFKRGLLHRYTLPGIMVLFLALATAGVSAQQTQVTGTVKDEKGEPVAAATVSVKGKNVSVTTATNGSFAISANASDVLVISAVSFATLEVNVTSASNYDIVLSTSSVALTDVVVVGYGRSSKRTLSSAITSIKPEDLNRGAIGDVGQLLQGKVPGLNITASGDPNRPAAIILRGASTINSPQGPFYVIDGIPGADINAVAPDDIASMDILKDASATAIYGNRASNGVIMVTTKKGKKGKLQAAYNGYVGFESVSSNLDLMDAAQLRAYAQKNNFTPNTNDDKGANTNWMKAVQKGSALSHNHNLSFNYPIIITCHLVVEQTKVFTAPVLTT